MCDSYRKSAVVPAKAGTQWLSPHDAGFPPSRERRDIQIYGVTHYRKAQLDAGPG